MAGTVTVHSSFYVTTTQSAFSSATPGDPDGPVQLAASGGTAPYKWKLTGGALPKGMKVHPNGRRRWDPEGRETPRCVWSLQLHRDRLDAQVQEGATSTVHDRHLYDYGGLDRREKHTRERRIHSCRDRLLRWVCPQEEPAVGVRNRRSSHGEIARSGRNTVR